MKCVFIWLFSLNVKSIYSQYNQRKNNFFHSITWYQSSMIDPYLLNYHLHKNNFNQNQTQNHSGEKFLMLSAGLEIRKNLQNHGGYCGDSTSNSNNKSKKNNHSGGGAFSDGGTVPTDRTRSHESGGITTVKTGGNSGSVTHKSNGTAKTGGRVLAGKANPNTAGGGATTSDDRHQSEGGVSGVVSAGEEGGTSPSHNNRGTGTGVIIGRGTERQGLYYVDEVTHQGTVMLAHGSIDREAWLWHRRLGHPSTGYLHLLFPNLFPSKTNSVCETCVLAKSHRHTYLPNNTRVDIPFSLIHSDVWGPAKVAGGQNFRYFVIFVDDCTRMTWRYFLKHKSEVFEKFKEFHTMVETQFRSLIQILRSDNGGEFVNDSMKLFCKSKGIIHQTSCSHTPEQNGVSERKNRILLEITRALLIESQVPTSFWPEALAMATYLINRLPTKALQLKTPVETLTKFTKLPPPLTLEPKVFGCSVFVHIPKINRNKLGPCAEKCVFVGYGVTQKGYRCYNPKTRHMYTTMDCDFLETEYFYISQHNGQGEKEHADPLSWLTWLPSSEETSHNESLRSTQPAEPSVSATEQGPLDLIPEVSEFPLRESSILEPNDNSSFTPNHDIQQTVVEQGEQTTNNNDVQ
ncbi:putative RNA-directed DNA polymerase [Helianthus annuus]|nr:putative RNA-directed DNA polymerase [Helianthus annuus]KAJ0619652.1 putative RNA-directed DNA polymerase [Helianthus annuus]KAJ0778108.1 putative RNA-directed DNA polymerase [Helianthus annuus]